MSTIHEEYQSRYEVQFIDKLGEGKDGRVMKTDLASAVKFVHDASIYRRERYAYFILQSTGVDQVGEFQIPKLIRYDDELLAIEMTIVSPPFMLDFASAYTEEEYERLDFPEDVLAERAAHWLEIYGERWPIVQAACGEFTDATGLVLLDLNPNNIRFA